MYSKMLTKRKISIFFGFGWPSIIHKVMTSWLLLETKVGGGGISLSHKITQLFLENCVLEYALSFGI